MYCAKCGAEIMDEAVVCPKCGCATKNASVASQGNATNVTSYSTASSPEQDISSAKTLGIIAIIAGLFIPLAGWICGGIGLSKASNLINRGINTPDVLSAKRNCIIGICVASVIFLIALIAML